MCVLLESAILSFQILLPTELTKKQGLLKVVLSSFCRCFHGTDDLRLRLSDERMQEVIMKALCNGIMCAIFGEIFVCFFHKDIKCSSVLLF
jgi:hypothetical protein